MTTVRGKDPLKLTFNPEIEVSSYGQSVTIKSGGWCGETRFYAQGTLGPECTRRLILELRKGLRKIRDETKQRLDNAITQAEAPL